MPKMHISTEGRLGLWSAVIALAGSGAIMIWPTHTEIGWLLIAIAGASGLALMIHHICDWMAKLQTSRRNRTETVDEVATSHPISSNPEERLFMPSSVSLEDMIKPFKDATMLEARGLTAKYLEKWMKINARVDDISTPSQNVTIVTYKVHFFLGPTVFLYFVGKHATQVALLSKNTQFVAIGRVDAIHKPYLVLNGCELEAVSSPVSGAG